MIPTSVSVAEHEELLQLARGRRVVEVGALLGATTVKLSRAASSLISIDRHEGYGPSTLSAYLSNLARYADDVDVRIGDGPELLGQCGSGVDLVFIDLTGRLELTAAAIAAAPPGAVICIHDLERPNCEIAAAVRAAGRRIAYHIDRRRFLQFLGGTAAGVALAPYVDVDRLLWTPGQKTIFIPEPAIELVQQLPRGTFLTADWLTKEALRLLENNLAMSTMVNRSYDDTFGHRMGDTVRVALPPRYTVSTKAALLPAPQIDYVPVTLDHQRCVDLRLTDEFLADHTPDQVIEATLKPAMRVMAHDIQHFGMDVFGDLPLPFDLEGSVQRSPRIALRGVIFEDPLDNSTRLRFDVLGGSLKNGRRSVPDETKPLRRPRRRARVD